MIDSLLEIHFACFLVLVWTSFYVFQNPSSEGGFSTRTEVICGLDEKIHCNLPINFTNRQYAECSNWLIKASTLLENGIPSSIASVVIVAHNEIESILLGTIESILANTSHCLLKEIIIVDDSSQPPIELKSNYFKVQVTLIRNAVRQGLIRSRLIGASEASGKVLIFSDSHIRFEQKWLDSLLIPLLNYEQSTIKPKLLVLSPFISAFTEDGQEYPAANYLRGGFDWDLTFTWEPMTEAEKEILNSRGTPLNLTWLSMPRASPVIAGSVIAVLRTHFIANGAFDNHMEIWGGENIELSLRAWMCGGRVEILPCSRVSHLFRGSHSYTFPKGKVATIMRNLNRVANVWLQSSRALEINAEKNPVSPLVLFYSAQPGALKVPVGNLSSRRALRQRLECEDFAWFVENIYPELRSKAETVRLLDSAVVHAMRLNITSRLK